jgi:polysaccharide deacetylase family protein (PEP-CTERM system associated)
MQSTTQQFNSLNTSKPIINALSVDVEEYYHATIFQEAITRNPPQNMESRVENSIECILTLLEREHVHATFFVLGEVAELHRGMIKRIAEAGHEVACHGYHHELISQLSPETFRKDIRRAKAVLEDTIGQAVIGYRAPSFSIGREQAWAYDILLQEGFRYDSSLYPILHDRYGQAGAPRFPHEILRNRSGSLIESPAGTTRLLGVNLPIGGGGWFRLLPFALVRWGIQRVNATEKKGVVFYFHPWELDVHQPRPAMSWYRQFRLYVGLARMEAKLAKLLRNIPFTTVREILGL